MKKNNMSSKNKKSSYNKQNNSSKKSNLSKKNNSSKKSNTSKSNKQIKMNPILGNKISLKKKSAPTGLKGKMHNHAKKYLIKKLIDKFI